MKIGRVLAAMLLIFAVFAALQTERGARLTKWAEEQLGAAKAAAEKSEREAQPPPASAKPEAVPLALTPQPTLPPFPSEVEIPERPEPHQADKPIVLPTTIDGGMVINNDTGFEVDLEVLMAAGPSQKLPASGYQVLIIHTHTSEAYTPDSDDNYMRTDSYRTEDTRYNIVRVGDELTACLESFGLSVLHDRESYDYPSYTGSYSRSGAAIERHLARHPEIAIVLDVHRDAIGSNDTVYKTVAELDGRPCSQIMLLAGTGENGLSHPNYMENIKLALYMQKAVVDSYPTLARPIAMKKERYNQQLTTGSLILEVGSSGNTLEEALRAVRLFADAVGPALVELKTAQ